MIDEIRITPESMSEAIRAALENREIPVDAGSKIFKVKPHSFDFIKRQLTGNVIENGSPVILKEVSAAE
jgi:hypothetical protein